jgi:hypothetical protein
VDEPTPSQPNGSARPKLARALTANVRRSGEKSSFFGRVLTAGLVVVLAGALAVGVGALTVKHHKDPKTSNAANAQVDPNKTKSPSRPPLANAPVPVPIAPPGKAAPGAKKPTPGAKKSSKATKGSGAGAASGAKSQAHTNQLYQASVPTASIVSYASGKCIDVTNEGQTGTPIEIWQCSPITAWKTWAFYSDGTIRSQGHCMTVAGGSGNGTPIEVAGCNGGASQRFNLNNAHDLVNIAADKCVDVKDQNTDNGTKLQLWSCGGTSNQKWHT